jgi:hypothetical protein
MFERFSESNQPVLWQGESGAERGVDYATISYRFGNRFRPSSARLWNGWRVSILPHSS